MIYFPKSLLLLISNNFADQKSLSKIYYDISWWRHQIEKKIPRYWPFVQGIHRSPMNSSHKGQWRGALVFPVICAWINGWVNNRKAGDLRRHCGHYDVVVMSQHNLGTPNSHLAWSDLKLPRGTLLYKDDLAPVKKIPLWWYGGCKIVVSSLHNGIPYTVKWHIYWKIMPFITHWAIRCYIVRSREVSESRDWCWNDRIAFENQQAFRQ